jgi:hypothetical protein
MPGRAAGARPLWCSVRFHLPSAAPELESLAPPKQPAGLRRLAALPGREPRRTASTRITCNLPNPASIVATGATTTNRGTSLVPDGDRANGRGCRADRGGGKPLRHAVNDQTRNADSGDRAASNRSATARAHPSFPPALIARRRGGAGPVRSTRRECSLAHAGRMVTQAAQVSLAAVGGAWFARPSPGARPASTRRRPRR